MDKFELDVEIDSSNFMVYFFKINLKEERKLNNTLNKSLDEVKD